MARRYQNLRRAYPELDAHYSPSKPRDASTAESLKPSIENIPLDPQEFYEDFGFLRHPRTGEPVKTLTPYQYEVWKAGQRYRYRLVVKSQKSGMTTSSLLEDIQRALTSCKGREILVIAQKFEHAVEHLRTLKYMMVGSTKYAKYLMRDSEFLFKEEKTKVRTVYIRNPDNPKLPTRIIALGSNESAIWSWKNVAHIHMSDVAATNQKDDAGLFGAALTRLANTNGTMLIESPPRGERGTVYKIYRQSKLKVEDPDAPAELGKFKPFEISAREAVAAGLITQEFLDAERQRLGPLYGQYYECEFLSSSNIWYPGDLLDKQGDYEIGL